MTKSAETIERQNNRWNDDPEYKAQRQEYNRRYYLERRTAYKDGAADGRIKQTAKMCERAISGGYEGPYGPIDPKEAKRFLLNKYDREVYSEKRYVANIQRKHGLSAKEYYMLLGAQGGKCAICGEDEPVQGRLSVDHDHKTGAVRALLCTDCNKGLGNFKDDVGLMKKAIDYLERR